MVRKHIPTVEGKSGPDGGPISVDIDNDFVYYYRTLVLVPRPRKIAFMTFTSVELTLAVMFVICLRFIQK